MTTISLAFSTITGATCLMAYGLPCHLRPKAKIYTGTAPARVWPVRALPCGRLQPLRRRLRHVPATVLRRVWKIEWVFICIPRSRRIFANSAAAARIPSGFEFIRNEESRNAGEKPVHGFMGSLSKRGFIRRLLTSSSTVLKEPLEKFPVWVCFVNFCKSFCLLTAH